MDLPDMLSLFWGCWAQPLSQLDRSTFVLVSAITHREVSYDFEMNCARNVAAWYCTTIYRLWSISG
jgi:hypothetical protein